MFFLTLEEKISSGSWSEIKRVSRPCRFMYSFRGKKFERRIGSKFLVQRNKEHSRNRLRIPDRHTERLKKVVSDEPHVVSCLVSLMSCNSLRLLSSCCVVLPSREPCLSFLALVFLSLLVRSCVLSVDSRELIRIDQGCCLYIRTTRVQRAAETKD